MTYKIGERKILWLLSRAKLRAGKMFDIKEFHRTILDCPGSIDIWNTCVNNWLVKLSKKHSINEEEGEEEGDELNFSIKDKKGKHLVKSLLKHVYKLYKLTV